MSILPAAALDLRARLKLNRHWNDVLAIYTLRVISVTVDHQKNMTILCPGEECADMVLTTVYWNTDVARLSSAFLIQCAY